ncbi:MAG: HAMP domain-containing protein [Candidatus Competibacteraceae bacterium]|nr:HAMP domain-containing protein [Candidatus Competibacteraceae bacterium]
MIYLITGLGALALFAWVLHGVTQQLGENFAIQYVLRQKDRLLGPIQRELALARKLADSPLLKRWVRDEYDADLRTAALAELDSYRRYFADHSFFFVINASRNYYHNSAADDYRGRELVQTLDPARASDQWYFSTLARVANFDLNVDYDVSLDVYKLWFNVIIRDGEEKLGVGGTGLELDRFIQAALHEDRPGVRTLLLDRDGAIKAYDQRAYIDFNTVAKSKEARSTLYRLLASPEEQTLLSERLEQLRRAQIPIAVLPLTISGQSHLAAIAYLAEIDWFALALVDTEHIYNVRQFTPFAILLAFSLLTLAVAIALLLNRLVLNPLAQLHHSTQAVAAGDYRPMAIVDNDNEIGALSNAFNTMTLTVRRHTEQLEQRVEERTGELQQAH